MNDTTNYIDERHHREVANVNTALHKHNSRDHHTRTNTTHATIASTNTTHVTHTTTNATTKLDAPICKTSSCTSNYRVCDGFNWLFLLYTCEALDQKPN
ncbi:hypothetical protein ACSQ67_003697 [Phaseolus vulgaris]